ncbi:hypothetical protein GF312_09180 [Candidatus Poribacteria bacterium]|nr:hypothetical protein [Candidatus Poribacteria bacterium]
MILWQILFAVGIGFLFTAIFTLGFRRRGTKSGIILFLIVIILASWAGGLWINPTGPSIVGVYWVPFVIVGFIFAIILAGTLFTSPQREIDVIHAEQAESSIEDAANIFLWLLIGILLVMVILGYSLR